MASIGLGVIPDPFSNKVLLGAVVENRANVASVISIERSADLEAGARWLAAACAGMKSICHEFNVPVSYQALSLTVSVQVPFAMLPSNAERTVSGLNEPVNGAVLFCNNAVDSSSNTVLIRFWPSAPRRLNRVTTLLVGDFNVIIKSPT